MDVVAELTDIARAQPHLATSPWHAAQVVAALGARAPARLWKACVADLDARPWAPWTAIAARARGDAETFARCEGALVGSVRRAAPHAGGVSVTTVPEVALTALTVEALAGATSADARHAVARAREFLLAWQFTRKRIPAALDHEAALGAFPASPVASVLRCDIVGHAVLAARRAVIFTTDFWSDCTGTPRPTSREDSLSTPCDGGRGVQCNRSSRGEVSVCERVRIRRATAMVAADDPERGKHAAQALQARKPRPLCRRRMSQTHANTRPAHRLDPALECFARRALGGRSEVVQKLPHVDRRSGIGGRSPTRWADRMRDRSGCADVLLRDVPVRLGCVIGARCASSSDPAGAPHRRSGQLYGSNDIRNNRSATSFIVSVTVAPAELVYGMRHSGRAISSRQISRNAGARNMALGKFVHRRAQLPE